ncbi:hypothetical protein WN943_027298 [Citrus x changshan-huyou]
MSAKILWDLYLDLSSNKLCGVILEEIMDLAGMTALNLSRNNLTLSGLSALDLSYNNLSGKIPLSTQLQNFNASFDTGNLELCGLPLPNKCADEESTPSPSRDDDANTPEDEDDQFITLGFYVSLSHGP